MPHDRAIVQAAQQGDKQALLRLLEASRPDLKRIAVAECASIADADDAVQESLIQVYRRIGALRTITSYGAWLFTIVRHECQRLMRRMRGRTELPGEDDQLFAYYTTPDLHIDLVAAIESLPDKYRKVIILRDFEEYTIAEIADSLHLSLAAIKSRVHRGRVLIREYLTCRQNKTW